MVSPGASTPNRALFRAVLEVVVARARVRVRPLPPLPSPSPLQAHMPHLALNIRAHPVRVCPLAEVISDAIGASSSSAPEYAFPPEDIRILSGHSGEVFACAFNPTRPDLLATGSGDGSGRVWDVSTARGSSSSSSSGPGVRSLELKHAPVGPEGGAGSTHESSEGKDVASLDWSVRFLSGRLLTLFRMMSGGLRGLLDVRNLCRRSF
jgi:WD40 repeat protein